MAFTYSKLAEFTVASTTTSNTIITFNNIPQNYTDLKLVGSLRDSQNVLNGGYLRVRFNNSFSDASRYSLRELQGNGQTVGSGNDSATYFNINFSSNQSDGNTANTFQSFDFYIPNYSNGTTFKSVSFDTVSEQNGTNAYADLGAGLWSDLSPINTIQITFSFGVKQHTSFYLYGIKAEV
jgi:hypothetical protein